jgi:hypothetical protein
MFQVHNSGEYLGKLLKALEKFTMIMNNDFGVHTYWLLCPSMLRLSKTDPYKTQWNL